MNTGERPVRVDLTHAQWRRTAPGTQDGESRVEVAFVEDAVAVRDAKDPDGTVLIFTRQEWDAFVSGAKAGEFDLD